MAGYQEHLETLNGLGVAVVGISVDEPDDTRQLVDKLDLGFPLVCGFDGAEGVERYDAYRHDKGFLHPANFLLRSGKIEQMTYSSGPLGRLQPDEVIKWVKYIHKKESGDD